VAYEPISVGENNNVAIVSKPVSIQVALRYHVMFVPKYRRKVMFGEIRQFLGPIFHELARQKECRIIEKHLIPDHLHMKSLMDKSIG
jgi:putative transposase